MLTIVLLAALQASSQAPLNLTCLGGGTANKATFSTVDTDYSGSAMVGGTIVSGNGESSSTITGMRQQGFADQVDIQLFGGEDRIRLPRTMLPILHGGDGGWFKLKNVVVDARSIRAKASINLINSPNVFIDRVTGTISISGKAGDFTGRCERMQADAPARF